MRQTASIISTYSPDVFGVCSALFELGGMVIMHDASGCNSTYNTHDEPRWYDMDSMVYISGLSEMEAVMGDDEKLIGDITEAAKELNPKFIVVAGTPIPMMIGTDFKAMSKVIEKRTGIPCFGLDTNGMHSYIGGVSHALMILAEHFTEKNIRKSSGKSVNIIGLTPLDFSVNGCDTSIKKILNDSGYEVISSWAMGSSLEEIGKAGSAQVNLVVSADGIDAAEKLHELYGTPYVIGVPFGTKQRNLVLECLEKAIESGENMSAYPPTPDGDSGIVIIAESVFGASAASELLLSSGINARVICPVGSRKNCLRPNDIKARDEDELMPYIKSAKLVIADPLHRPLCSEGTEFVKLPSEAFSGRIYRNEIVNLCEDFNKLEKEVKKHV